MIAKNMKISPDNFRWYAAFHNESYHPHIHMMAYSTDPGEAYLFKTGIREIKATLSKQIFRQDLISVPERVPLSQYRIAWRMNAKVKMGAIDRKLKRIIDEKKQAHGLKQG